MATEPGSVRSWISRIGRESAPASEMARVLAYLYAAGAGFALVSASLPLSGWAWAALPAAVAAFGVAAGLWLRGERLSHPGFQALTLAGTAAVSAGVLKGGAQGSAYVVLYVWVAVYSFYFFSEPEALLQAIAIAILSAVALLASPPLGGASVPAPLAVWLALVASCLVVGMMVHRLAAGLRARARTDFLTGAANRRAWDEEVGWALERARREHHSVCVVLLDLDHFKAFNDEHGHREGDLFLQRAAVAWKRTLRGSDLLARYGGEEFAVLLPACSPDGALVIADRLRAATQSGQTCSAGVAAWDATESAVALVARVDAALYEAKRQGRNRTVVAVDRGSGGGSSPVIFQTARWADPILRALAGERMESVYQPVVRLRDRVVVGYEALARPLGSPPETSVEGLFTAAQRMGVLRDLDWLCRRAALGGAAAIPAAQPLFLNVSLTALLDPLNGVEQMLVLLAASGRSPSQVVLEISEREPVNNLARLGVAVQGYRAHGFTLALDDVGQGHSELEVLATLTPEYIKISGPFVDGIDESGASAAVQAVLSFARATGARVIAEGVESEDAARRLAGAGVEMGQGFWLGAPVPAGPAQRKEASTA
ncbi:MAG: EAL domain-containing protein [Candidatus Dormibacterales bacterium]